MPRHANKAKAKAVTRHRLFSQHRRRQACLCMSVCLCVCMTHAPSCHCGTVRPFWYAQWSLCCASWLVHSKWAKLLPWLMAKEFIEPQVVAIWTVMSVASAKGGRNWLIWHRQRHSGCVFRTSQVAQVVSVGCFCLGSICIKFAYEFRVDKLQAAHCGSREWQAAASGSSCLKAFWASSKTNWPTSMTTMKPLTAAAAVALSALWDQLPGTSLISAPPLCAPSPLLSSNIYGPNVTFYFVANTTICFLAQSLYSSIYFSSCRWSH